MNAIEKETDVKVEVRKTVQQCSTTYRINTTLNFYILFILSLKIKLKYYSFYQTTTLSRSEIIQYKNIYKVMGVIGINWNNDFSTFTQSYV